MIAMDFQCRVIISIIFWKVEFYFVADCMVCQIDCTEEFFLIGEWRCTNVNLFKKWLRYLSGFNDFGVILKLFSAAS